MRRKFYMIFNKHSELEGRHAILSPSKHYWLKYDDEALLKLYSSSFVADIGTLVHEYACDRIRYRLPLDAENEEAKNGLLLHLMKNGIPFRAIDLDNNNCIDKEEFKECSYQVAKGFGLQNPSDESIEEVYRNLDLDGNGTIEFEEFKKYVKQLLIIMLEEM